MFSSSAPLVDVSLPDDSSGANKKVCAGVSVSLIVAAVIAGIICVVIAVGGIPGVSFTSSSSSNSALSSTGLTRESIGLNPSSCNYSAASVFPGILYTFETPYTADFVYGPPTSVTQPFTWIPNNSTSALGGLAAQGGPYQAVGNATLPSGRQFAILQDAHGIPSTMQASLSNLTVGSQYQLSFYWNTRAETAQLINGNPEPLADNTTSSTLTAYLNTPDSGLIYNSNVDLADPTGSWNNVTSSTFTATSCVTTLVLSVNPSTTFDQTILVDNLLVSLVS